MPPLWLVALIIAAVAPFCAAALQAVLESRLRRRTKATLERALSSLGTAQSGEAHRQEQRQEHAERSGEGSRGESAES